MVRASLCAVLLVLWSLGQSVSAQVNLDGRSTAKELKQIRQAVNSYVDRTKGLGYGSRDIRWDSTNVMREDLDGVPPLDAQVHIYGYGLCGASSCPNAIVVWRNGRPRVISVIQDAMLSPMNVKSRGMYGLVGHYYSYKWDGNDYQTVCLEVNVCHREILIEQERIERERAEKP